MGGGGDGGSPDVDVGGGGGQVAHCVGVVAQVAEGGGEGGGVGEGEAEEEDFHLGFWKYGGFFGGHFVVVWCGFGGQRCAGWDGLRCYMRVWIRLMCADGGCVWRFGM